MICQLHHIALNVDDLEWYIDFFQKVFHMEIRKITGAAPSRKVWFTEGVQLNECFDLLSACGIYDHIAFAVPNIEETVKAALQMGCTSLSNKEHWFALPNGQLIELISIETKEV